MENKRWDGWKNIFSGLGGKYDKSTYTTFQNGTILPDQMLADLWNNDGFSAKIVKTKPDDMIREWVSIENDTEHVIENKLDLLDSPNLFNLALVWSRLYGGSLIIIGINDNRKLNEPVNINQIKSIDWLRVIEKPGINILYEDFDTNPNNKTFGNPLYYDISPLYGETYKVHRTRVIEFKGLPASKYFARDYDQIYWGMSVLQQIWDQLKDIAAGERNIAKLLYEIIIGKLKIKDLARLMAEGDKDKIQNILDTINLGKSTINSLILDADGDDFSRDSVNLSGIDKILYVLQTFLAGVSGYPVSKLFGRSAAGENATGEGDEKNYYMEVKADQRNILRKPIQKLVNYINISKEVKNKVVKPAVIFNPLFLETKKELIEYRKIVAETDQIYIQNQVLSPEEVRENRFNNGYSTETITLDEEESAFNVE